MLLGLILSQAYEQQQVKARRPATLLCEEDSFVEDVEEFSPLLAGEESRQVFRAECREEGGEEEQVMVTIVNPSVREGSLKKDDEMLPAGVNTSDHPVSLVYANNEDKMAVNITTPTLTETTDQVEMKPTIDLPKQGWGTPDVVETSLVEDHDNVSEETEIPQENAVLPASPVVEKQTELSTGMVEDVSDKGEEEVSDKVEEAVYEDAVRFDEQDDQDSGTDLLEDQTALNIYHLDPSVHQVGYQVLSDVEDKEKDNREEDSREEDSREEEGREAEKIEKEKEASKAPNRDEYGNDLDEEGVPIIQHPFPEGWVLQEDQGDGIMRFETEDGPVRFIMNLTEGGFNYPNPPNDMRLEKDVYLKHIPITHLIASGCEFFVDTGEWRLELETHIINLLLRMDIAKDFQDVTGEVLWNQNKDITVQNLTRAMTIFKDCILDDSPVRWILMKDAEYNPKSAVFRLKSETQVENITKGFSIHDGMAFVNSETKVSIPSQSDTEVRNVKQFLINKDCTLEDQGTRHLDSGEATMANTFTEYRLEKDLKLEDQGTRHLLSDGTEVEDQGKRHLICEGGELSDITLEHRLNKDLHVKDINREHRLCGDSDKVDIKRHFLELDQHIDRTPNRWDRAQFEGDVVDMTQFRVEMDIKYEKSPCKFNLNQLDIDDDMLAEIEDEEDEG